ncbi:MAG TPA: hypothetical protein VEA41_15760 [Salinarimonas sp.]|jgi:hypothetical protein|nr:hypothetical protein [Salinarimonas sp.]
MNFFTRLTSWFRPGSGEGSHDKSDLQKNMEKALEMKKAAGPQTNIPEHATRNEGLQRDHVNENVDRQEQHGAFEPQLKRTRGTRQGDAGG